MKGASSVIITSKKGMQLFKENCNLFWEENAMITINAPMFFHSHTSAVGSFLSKRIYIFDGLPSSCKFEAFLLNWKKCPWLLPLLIWRKIAERNNKKNIQNAIDQTRKKYNWT